MMLFSMSSLFRGLRVLVPVFLDHVHVGCVRCYEVAVAGNVFLAGLDFECTVHHRSKADIGLIGMDPDGLWRSEVLRTAKHGSGYVLAVDLAGECNPARMGVIAFPAIFTVTR